jgi:hypothetical protein
MGNTTKLKSGFWLRSTILCCRLIKASSFSSSYNQRDGEKNYGVLRAGKTLPWLESNKAKEVVTCLHNVG